MGVPTSVGYTPAMPRREDHEVYKDMWWHWGGGTFGGIGPKHTHTKAWNSTVWCVSNKNSVVGLPHLTAHLKLALTITKFSGLSIRGR